MVKRCGSTDSLCTGCPFGAYELCFDEIKLAALALIKKQEKEINQLKTECTLLDDELRNARQETINVLNELKAKSYVNEYCPDCGNHVVHQGFGNNNGGLYYPPNCRDISEVKE